MGTCWRGGWAPGVWGHGTSAGGPRRASLGGLGIKMCGLGVPPSPFLWGMRGSAPSLPGTPPLSPCSCPSSALPRARGGRGPGMLGVRQGPARVTQGTADWCQGRGCIRGRCGCCGETEGAGQGCSGTGGTGWGDCMGAAAAGAACSGRERPALAHPSRGAPAPHSPTPRAPAWAAGVRAACVNAAR